MGCRKLTYGSEADIPFFRDYQSQGQEAVKPFLLKNTDTLRKKVQSEKKCDSYYPFGMVMAGTAYNDISRTDQLYKFNGNEVLEGEGIPSSLNLMNFNARLYNPALGVFLAIDPMATSFAGLTPYNFGFNNPTLLSDPNGECPVCLIALATVWLTFTESGYEFQKIISPVAFKVNIHIGSQQNGIGFDASIGGLKFISPVSYRVHAGSTYYWGSYANSYNGWERRYGAEWAVNGHMFGVPALISYSGTTFVSGETSQTTNMITVGNPLANVKYENDYMFGLEKIIPFVPKADNGDRYRTAAARITVGSSKAQLNLFTGDPGLGKERYDPNNLQYNTTGPHAGKYTFTGGTPNKYRAGALTLSFGPFRFGWDSEGIRHRFQNLLTHNRKKNNYTPNGLTPHFQHMGGSGSLFWYFGFGTGNTLW